MEGQIVWLEAIAGIVKFLGGGWGEEMIMEAARLAYQENYWLSLAEVKYFSDRCKTGKYQSNKNFSPSVFMGWLNEYSNEIHSTRGDVMAYDWKRKIKEPEEEGGEVKYISDELMKEMFNNLQMALNSFRQAEDGKEVAELKRLNDNRQKDFDELTIRLVEVDGADGVAPQRHMVEAYLKALKRKERIGSLKEKTIAAETAERSVATKAP